MAVPEKLPQRLTELIPRIIFARTRKSVEALHRGKTPGYFYYHVPFSTAENFNKWGAVSLGLYVLSEGSIDPRDTIVAAVSHFHQILNEDPFNLEALYYGSLAYTFHGLTLDAVTEAQPYRIRYFIAARNFLEKAKRKDGDNVLCHWCEDTVLKAQRTYLDAHDHTALFRRILDVVSSSASDEENDSSETTAVGIEDVIKCLNEEARKELNRLEARNNFYGNDECTTSEDEVLDEVSDEVSDEEFEISDEVYRQFLIERQRTVKRFRDGYSDTEKEPMEVHKPASSEQNVVELSSSAPNEEGTQQHNSSDAMGELDNSLFEEYGGFFGDFIQMLRSQQWTLLSELDNFGDCPNSDIQKLCTEVHKPATNELSMDGISSSSLNDEIQKSCTEEVHMLATNEVPMDDISSSSNDEKQKRVDKTFVEIKDFIQFLIFEQFGRSAAATYNKDSPDAEKMTQWGAAVLGLSLTRSGQEATDYLNFAISKLEEALGINSDYTDALCYISNAYAALFWLTSDFSKSVWYFYQAKEYIQKAIGKDPAEALFLEFMAVTSSLMDVKKKLMRSRKYADAFGEEE